MASSESRKRKLEEYEMQLFGFHSRAVYATLKSLVHERIQYNIEKMFDPLEKTFKQNPENLTKLKANKRQLNKAYHKGAIPYLRNIENIVNKYIAVPNNVLLEEDKCQKIQYTDAEFQNLKQNLEDLQHRAKRATILNAALKEELQILDQFTVCNENASEMCNIIENGLACPDIKNKMYELVEDYNQFTVNIKDTISVSHKAIYNTIDDLNCKCKDYDLDNL